MRRMVEACILVYEHNHPHLLLLQPPGDDNFYLPGDILSIGEDEITGLKRILDVRFKKSEDSLGIASSTIAPTTNISFNTGTSNASNNWEIVDLLGCWWRPNFDHNVYPYLAPHVKKPKEQRKIYLVKLSPANSIIILFSFQFFFPFIL